MPYVRIRPRRDTEQHWNEANPILKEGELGIQTPDEGIGKGLVVIKIGDGTSSWTTLPFAIASTISDLIDSDKELVVSPNDFAITPSGQYHPTGYEYRAKIQNGTITSKHIVSLSPNDATRNLGVLSCESDSYDGGVYIYASSVPSTSVVFIEGTKRLAVIV